MLTHLRGAGAWSTGVGRRRSQLHVGCVELMPVQQSDYRAHSQHWPEWNCFTKRVARQRPGRRVVTRVLYPAPVSPAISANGTRDLQEYSDGGSYHHRKKEERENSCVPSQIGGNGSYQHHIAEPK